MMIRLTLIFVYIFLSNCLYCQILINKEIPFYTINNKLLLNPLTGGIDNAQIGEFDLNHDGQLDIVIFDRAGDILIPLVYDVLKKQYIYSPKYKKIFPKFKDWLVFKDYNQDGLMDLFSCSFNTEGVPGIVMHKTSWINNEYQFSKFDMNWLYKVLVFQAGSASANIPVDFTDLPSIDDVDGDGDFDIVTFEPGSNRLTLFQNIVKERAYPNDTMAFIIADRCYGRFVESGLNSDIKLSGRIDTCANLFFNNITNRHAGSTVLSLDLNGDPLRDLLIGDLTSTGVVALYNGGFPQEAWMTSSDIHWPSESDSVNINIFLSAFDVDVDHDGLRDVLIAPNLRSISENANNISYYRNVGLQNKPKFQLETRSAFVSEMIDLGAGSDPCFIDYNQDGLVDIVVGTEGYVVGGSNSRLASLFLFENIGSLKLPKFKLVDSNYLDFKRFSTGSDVHYNFSPCFGDLDGDGDLDMLVGENQGQYFYCENLAGKNRPFVFNTPVYPFQDLSVKSNSSPYLVDLNRDGLIDIVSGTKINTNNTNNQACGSFYYFQNQGTIQQAVFDPDYYKSPNTNCLGKIIVNSISSKSYTCPEVYNFNGVYKLFTGNIYGEMKIISNIENNIQGQFIMENPNYGQINEGERLTLSLADIDDDGILDMVTGNSRGGLAIYNTTLKLDGSVKVDKVISNEVLIYPNPSNGKLIMENTSNSDYNIEIYSIDGYLIFSDILKSNTTFLKNFEPLQSNLFYIKGSSANLYFIYKWLKI